MKGLLRFICTLIVIVIVIALALAIFDLTDYAHDPENATANAIVNGVRNLFPADWVNVYDGWRAQFLSWLSDVLNFAESQV